MSLFDKARRAVNKAIDSAVTKKVTDVVEDTVSDLFTKAGVNPPKVYCPNCGKQLSMDTKFCTGCGAKVASSREAPRQSASYAATPARSEQPRYSNAQSWFTQILAEDLPEFSVQRTANAASLGIAAKSPAKPYDFALFRNGALAGVVMITEHNRDRNSAFLNAKAAAVNAGVPFINFYTHMDNERSYVASRIRKMAR